MRIDILTEVEYNKTILSEGRKVMKRLVAIVLLLCTGISMHGCGNKSEDILRYRLSENEKYYIVEGIGKIQDRELFVPEEYKGLPVREIADGAFDDCDELTSIVMTDSVITVGSNVFNDCDNLIKVEIPGVTSLSKGVFNGCTSIEEISIPVDFLAYLENKGSMRLSVDNIKKITITPGVEKTKIRNKIFRDCTNLECVYVKTGITEIGDEAFMGCINLNTVILCDGLNTICENAFKKCISLDSIKFPGTLTRIESGAFWGCSSITNVILPDSVETLGGAVFRECVSLEEVILSENLGRLSSKLFDGCPIKEIYIPENVWQIQSDTFADTELEKVIFENVSGWAFWEDDERHSIKEEGISDSDWIAVKLKEGRADGIGRYDVMERSRA